MSLNILKYDLFTKQECVEISNWIDKDRDKNTFFYYFPEYHSKLISCLKVLFPNLEYPIAVQSWCNSYNKDQYVDWNNHYGFIGLSYSATIFIGGNPDIGFKIKNPVKNEVLDIKNKLGEIVFFGCEFYHRSLKNYENFPRKIIGMTIHDFSVTSTKIILKNCCINERINDTILLIDTL